MRTLDVVLGWILAVVSLAIMVVVLWWGVRCQRSSRLSISTKRETLVALRSGFVLLVMTIPLLDVRLWDLFPQNLKDIYPSLPFWYCFVVDTHFGRCLRSCCNALVGVLIAALSMVFMNYLMPGGAGPWADDPEYVEGAWVPGGYNQGVALAIGACIAYMFFLIDFDASTKQYGLGGFSCIFLDFMNPDQEPENFRGVLWTWDGVPTFSGPTWCQFYLNISAVTLGMLTLPGMLTPPCSPFRYCPRQTSWSRDDAVQGYAQLAQDTMLGFERLVMHFRKGSSAFALDSSYLFLKQLGERRKVLEQLLEDARWETTSPSQLRELRRLSKFLQGLRQVLRVALEDLRQFGHSFDFDEDIEEISVYLDSFLTSCKDVLATLGSPEMLRDGADHESLMRVAKCAREGQDALTRALKRVGALGAGGARTTRLEAIFIEGLQTFSSLVDECLDEPEPASRHGNLGPHLWREKRCPSRKRHLNAIRMWASWVLALFWCTFKRNYSPTALATVSFIFSESLGGMFDKNVNRMLGVSMGLVIGTVPAVMLTRNAFCTQDMGIEFDTVPKIAAYMVVMYLFWTTAMYGYLAAGAKWSSAYLLWAALAGVQMLKYFPVPGADGSTCNQTANTFVSIFDNFTGCLILVFTDLTFAICTSSLTVHRLAQRVPDCLQDVLVIAEGLLERGPSGVDLDALRDHISAARSSEEEIDKEDLVWSHLFTQPFNRELVVATMSECDDIYVAMYALQASTKRCGFSISIPDIVAELMPRGLMSRVRRYPTIFKALLMNAGDPYPDHDEELFYEGEDCLRFQHVVCAPQQVEGAANELSLMVLRVRIWQICVSLQRLRVIFEERADWAAEEWNCTKGYERGRVESSTSGRTNGTASSAHSSAKKPDMPRGNTCQLREVGQDVLEFAKAVRQERLKSKDVAEDCRSSSATDVDPDAISLDLDGEAQQPENGAHPPADPVPQQPAAAAPQLGGGPPSSAPGCGPRPVPRWASSLLPCCGEAPGRPTPQARRRSASAEAAPARRRRA